MSTGTMLFNPFTGKPRDPRDIASDPRGLLVWDGEESLRAVALPFDAGELERLRSLAAACYVGLGAEHNLPERWLDVLLAAANGEHFSLDGLLPYRAAPSTQEG